MRWRPFLAGLAVGCVVTATAVYLVQGLTRSAMTSKSVHLLGQAFLLNDGVIKFRTRTGSYPLTREEVAAEAGFRDPTYFDYFSDGKSYTLISPAVTGDFKWDPAVFKDGKIVRWSGLIRDEIVAERSRGHATAPN